MDRGETGKHGVNVLNRVEAGNNSGHDNVTILPHSITVPTARATVQKHNNVEHNTVQVCVANVLIKSLQTFSQKKKLFQKVIQKELITHNICTVNQSHYVLIFIILSCIPQYLMHLP